jgi:ectoine hydroxylase-related dioxygenase (phytanoyl-CoA dioxygenase family)
LIKPVDVASGLADLPWHRDCAMGGHDYHCAGYAVGLPLTATGPEAGQLRVMAGSHRASLPVPALVDRYDPGLPVLELETQPGDVTVHVACLLHGTIPPRSIERTVVYTTFALEPLPA